MKKNSALRTVGVVCFENMLFGCGFYSGRGKTVVFDQICIRRVGYCAIC